MVLNLMGLGGDEVETSIRVKLWPVIAMLITGLVATAVYVAGHEPRICVIEKSIPVVEKKIDSVEAKVDKMAREQDLYFSLREPKWEKWKEWNEKTFHGENGGKKK